MSSPLPAEHRGPPLVHAPWTADWWRSRPGIEAIFGPHPAGAAFRAAGTGRSEHPGTGWARGVHHPPQTAVPDDALVVVAGQQPVLAGGPLLVAHKAATAIRLARHLERLLDRPVVALFLLADEDHDSDEVDHVDIINPSDSALSRIRCPVLPHGEALYRSRWDPALLVDAVLRTTPRSAGPDGPLRDLLTSSLARSRVSGHVAELLHDAFGHLGLLTIDAHALTRSGLHMMEDALANPADLAAELAAGAARLRAEALPISFDAEDRRPLVMESRGGRRRRVAAEDGDARLRLQQSPDDFSPHAALRPLIQAAALPVIAQVCGPSELLYLGQARGLHARYGLRAPILVPRLEATRLLASDVASLGGDLSRIDLAGATPAGVPLREELELLRAARSFAQRVGQLDGGLVVRTARWLAHVERGARRLAEAPVWRGRVRAATLQHLRPRGRWQDTVLAWLPDAWQGGRPAGWADRIVELCRPLDPPEHVLHVLPEETRDG